MEKKKILIVDDQAVYLQSLEFVLSKKYEVKPAINKDNALTILQQEHIDIAILDIRLSVDDPNNIDGLDILEWIQMRVPEISVFMMSAYSEFEYAEKALNLGAKYFFRKPIDINTMLSIIEKKG